MYNIAVIPGDGIGPEVINEGLKVLDICSKIIGFDYKTHNFPFGAEHYLKHQEVFPDSAIKEIKEMDAIFLGAIGDPRVETGFLERGIVLKLRLEFDLYVNLRPIKLYAEHLCPLKGKGIDDIDIMVVRENTEDVYLNIGGSLKKGTDDEVAIQEVLYTAKGVDRIIRYAFELAKKRPKKLLTLCDKANAMGSHDLWRRKFKTISKEYNDIKLDSAYVDAMCMWMIKKPEWFDVVVTTNMFGDIITDLGAILQGGLGIAAGGNINPNNISMFEPIHGSAPKYKNKGVANPFGAICALGMLLENIGEKKAAQLIEKSVINLLNTKINNISADSGFSTSQIGDMTVNELKRLAESAENI